jgi:inhibitor of cysteine peptidase
MNVVMKKVNVVIKKLKNSLILTCILSGIGCASEGMQLKLANQTSDFSFSLESNPSTGYQWTVNNYDTGKLQFLGSTYQAKKPVLVGSGGMQVFKFKVLNPSANLDTKISLSYARSWEKSSVKKQIVHVFYDK